MYCVNLADALIFVYDVTDEQSFIQINDLWKNVLESIPDHVQLMLLGNKIDDKSKRVVSRQKGQLLSASCNMSFGEVSAISGENVRNKVHSLISSVVKNYKFETLFLSFMILCEICLR